MGDVFQILALDGGGIKGLFSAAVLAYLEEDLKINITDHFDLITGTSTGGIIALGLGVGRKPLEIVQFYVDKGPTIFKQPLFPSIRHMRRNKYDGEPLEKALKDCFKEKQLADSNKRLIIPAYNIDDNSVYLFKTPHHKKLRRDYKVPMWKIARATSAAPTYFPAFCGVDGTRLVDGGVWANNPSVVGITEAVSLLNIPLEHIRVFNLGTTDELKSHPITLNNGGWLKWRKAAVDVIMRGQSVGAYTQSQHLIGKYNIERLSPIVSENLFAIDKLSVDELISKAANGSRHFSPRFKEFFGSHIAPIYEPIYHSPGEKSC